MTPLAPATPAPTAQPATGAAGACDVLERGPQPPRLLDSHRGIGQRLHIHLPWPGHGCADQIGWIKTVGPATTDVTAQFKALDRAVRAGRPILPPDAKDYVYVEVNGMSSGVVPHRLYMGENLSALRHAGCTTVRAPVNTFAGVRHNAAIIRDTILKYARQGKQVVLIGHSMGGVDAAGALALYPELRSHVRAFVTMQSPYGGTPMADDVSESPSLLHITSDVFKGLFHGSRKAVTDLTYPARRAFIAAHPMPAGIPTVCMASSRLSPLSALFSTQAYMKARYDLDSDGMVSPEDAFIPGSETVTLHGLDHLQSTGTEADPFAPAHPKDLTLALVALALEAPPRPAGD